MTQTADTQDPFALARDAAAVIAERTGVAAHPVAIVLGSGWQEAAAILGVTDRTVRRLLERFDEQSIAHGDVGGSALGGLIGAQCGIEPVGGADRIPS